MVPLCERDGWTQKLKLLEEAEETEVLGTGTTEVGLQGLESNLRELCSLRVCTRRGNDSCCQGQ